MMHQQHHPPSSSSSSPSPSPAPLLFLQVFPANDRPEQPPHDVRVSVITAQEAGCGAYGQVLLRLKNPKGRPDHRLHLPARLVPYHKVLPGHVVVAEAVMEALGASMGSFVEIELARSSSSSSSPVFSLHLMPLPSSSSGNSSSSASPAAVFHRTLREIGVGVVAVGSILMVRFLHQNLGFQVVEVEVEAQTSTGPQQGAETPGPRIIHVNKKDKEVQSAQSAVQSSAASSSSSFGSFICDEILEIAHQNKHAGGQRLPQNLQMKGILLSGPRGAGKSFLLQQLEQQHHDNKNICVVYVRGKNLVGPLLGGDDARVEEMLFHARKKTRRAAAAASFVLLLDDFDALLSGGKAITDTDDDGMQGDDGEEDEFGNNRDAVRGLERHLTGVEKWCCWVLATRQTLGGGGGKGGGARQRWLASLQGVLFDKVMEVPVPTPMERSSILQTLLRRQEETLTLSERVAEMTGGFLPGDLDTLCQVAALKAMASGRQEAATLADFLAARKEVSPAVLNGMARSSKQQQRKLSWDCIGGYEDVKARLRKLVEWPMLYGETFARLGLLEKQTASSATPLLSGGILFHGPSGCGKSLFARVLAAEVQANFVELPASEVFSAFLGDSEAKVRAAFARARRAAPCILFLDELDAMAAGREEAGGDGDGTGGVYARVLSTLLNEMDGVSGQAQGLLVVAATNRREAVDAALLRPGRLQESLLIPYPDPQRDYLSILQVATQGIPLEKELDLSEVAAAAASAVAAGRREREGHKAANPPSLTPANLVALCREAGLACLREADENENGESDDTLLVVRQRHFLQVMEKTLT